LEPEEEDVGDSGMDVEGDASFKSAYAVEPDQSDPTDDATHSPLGKSFVMGMREALASVQVRREFPGEVEMEDVGYSTSDSSVSEETKAAPVGHQQPTYRQDDAEPAAEMRELPGGDSTSPPAPQWPHGRTEEQAVYDLLEFARTNPGTWVVLLGLYLQHIVAPRAQAVYSRGGVVGQEGHLCGEWEPNFYQFLWRYIAMAVPVPFSLPQGPEGDFLRTFSDQIMQREDLYRRAVEIWSDGLSATDRPALESILLRAGWVGCC
jgi:hypothetical protein